MPPDSRTSKRIAGWSRAHFPQIPALGWPLCRRFYHRPLFVVGVGRSGTTALLRALDAHPAIMSTGEAPLFHHVGAIAYAYTGGPAADYYSRSSRIANEDLFAKLRRVAFESKWGPGYGVRGLLTRRLWHRKRLRSVRYWGGNAYPLGEAEAHGLQQLYPEARFVYIHRNGIENVQSRTRFHGFRADTFRKHAETWARATLESHYLTRWEAALTISHADFVSDRDATLGRVLDFLGLEPHPGPSEYAAGTLIHPLDQETASDVNVTELLGQRRPAHESWSDEQKQIFKEVCGKAMRLLEYPMPF